VGLGAGVGVSLGGKRVDCKAAVGGAISRISVAMGLICSGAVGGTNGVGGCEAQAFIKAASSNPKTSLKK